MSVYDLTDVDELAAAREEALDVFLRLSRDVLSLASETFQPEPRLNVEAVNALAALANYERLRRAHRTAVSG